MAANGYIVVAPNRRGMPGYGVEWNEQISKDWGGQVMDDYLSAIDDISKESYVDNARLGCVGASYGGYSAFYLPEYITIVLKLSLLTMAFSIRRACLGQLKFLQQLGFWSYWEKDNAIAQKTYTTFNPINLVEKWNTPILIIQGGKDFRTNRPRPRSFSSCTTA
jgi:dipeptidyl aminopeptidase/acylaminoacyl peptidase